MEKDEYLEYQYSPSRWSHRLPADKVIDAHWSTCGEKSKQTRASIESDLDQLYGDGEKLGCDFFGVDLPKESPVFVFVHGGYWIAGSRQKYSFVAGPLVAAGVVVAVMGYDSIPGVSMSDKISQARTGVRYIADWAEKRGSRGVFLTGHSAGAHLVAMCIAGFTDNLDAADNRLVKGAFLLSGVFDVRPLCRTHVNDDLQLTEDQAWSHSPLNYKDVIQKGVQGRHVSVVIGVHESDEFHKQSKEFYQVVQKHSKSSNYVEVSDADHFNLVEQIDQPDYSLTKMIIRRMRESL